MLAAVAEAWLVVALVALAAPHLLIVFAALAALYTIAAPPYLRRHLGRDVGDLAHGVGLGGEADGVGNLANDFGLGGGAEAVDGDRDL